MLKASALYIAIIIAFVIAIFTASLIATTYFYKSQNQKNQRYQRLSQNLQSGTNLMLSSNFQYSDSVQYIDLFNEANDSLQLKKSLWGVFDCATLASFTLIDTLKKSFLIAKSTSKDLTAIYLIDEDRPLSVSGTTNITGNVFIPKAGIKQAYVDGKGYLGKKLVNGKIYDSSRNLPSLDNKRLQEIEKWLDDTLHKHCEQQDTFYHSFFLPTHIIRLTQKNPIINTALKGNVIVLCDTVLTISPSAQLQDILVYAKAIVVQKGFKGSCQLFAKDSIIAQAGTVFNYPSCMGVLKLPPSIIQTKIVLHNNCAFSGIIFTYEAQQSEMQTLISLAKNTQIMGDVYANGLLKLESPVNILGKVACKRFIVQTPNTLYENYLIDLNINRLHRSKYYLSSDLFSEFKNSNNQLLKWLN